MGTMDKLFDGSNAHNLNAFEEEVEVNIKLIVTGVFHKECPSTPDSEGSDAWVEILDYRIPKGKIFDLQFEVAKKLLENHAGSQNEESYE